MLTPKSEYLSLLKCPINWKKIIDEQSLVRFLQLYWLETMIQFEVSSESGDYATISSDEIVKDDPDFNADLVNIRRWHGAAVAQYNKATRLFYNLRFATSEEYAKHFLAKSMPNSTVKELSKQGISYFYSNFNRDSIRSYLWSSISQRWRECINANRCLFFYKELSFPVGASHGRDTRLICFHVEPSNVLCHAYPIPSGEVPSGAFISDMYNSGDERDEYQDKHFRYTFAVTIDDDFSTGPANDI